PTVVTAIPRDVRIAAVHIEVVPAVGARAERFRSDRARNDPPHLMEPQIVNGQLDGRGTVEIEPEARLRRPLAAPERIRKVLVEECEDGLRADDERSSALHRVYRGAAAGVRSDLPTVRRVGLERVENLGGEVRWRHRSTLACHSVDD